jgi:hypothetical protein
METTRTIQLRSIGNIVGGRQLGFGVFSDHQRGDFTEFCDFCLSIDLQRSPNRFTASVSAYTLSPLELVARDRQRPKGEPSSDEQPRQ